MHAAVDPPAVIATLCYLLTVAVADPQSRIREAVLTCLSPRTDPYLAKWSWCRSSRMLARSARASERRRSKPRQPPHSAQPQRRRAGVVARTNTTAARGAGQHQSHRTGRGSSPAQHIDWCRSRVARPYALAIAVILAPLLSSDSPETGQSALAAAAALARAAGAALRDHLPSFVAAALATIQDQTATAQREAAVDALVHLTPATGYVIQPYEDHPALLPALFTLLNESKTPTLRTGALRVLGVIGAWDPYREKLQDTRLQAVILANKQRDAVGKRMVCAE